MSGAAAAVRLFSRSTSVRNAAAKISSGVKTTAPRLPVTKPLSHRIFRCPVELSACLETVQPVRTVTEPGFMPSVLVLSRSSYCWIPEGS